MAKIVLGLKETVTLYGKKGSSRVVARIDTGATKSSIDAKLAAKLNLGPVVRTTMVSSAHGRKVRPVVKSKIKVKGKVMNTEFTIADRDHMRYRVLIGQNILKRGFLIDPNK